MWKIDRRQTPSDGKSSCCLCKGELKKKRGRRDRDRMVVGITFTWLCNQCLSSLKMRVRNPFMARCTQYIMWQSLSMNYDRSVVFSGYYSFQTINQTWTNLKKRYSLLSHLSAGKKSFISTTSEIVL